MSAGVGIFVENDKIVFTTEDNQVIEAVILPGQGVTKGAIGDVFVAIKVFASVAV